MIPKNSSEQKRFNALYPKILHNGKIMHIGRLLQQAAQRLQDHTAIVFEDQQISYRTLYEHAVAVSRLLLQKGVKPGERVLLLLENSPEFYIGYFGITQVGAVVAPLNVFLKERELAHIITDAQPVLMITSKEFLPLLQSAGVPLPEIVTDIHQLPRQNIGDFEPISLQPDDMAALLYTSGTTGLPKGVMLSSANIMINVLQGITRFELTHHDRIFAVLPLFHSFAQNTCVWSPMLIGCTVILVRKIDRRLIVQGMAQKPTVFLGVPALYGFLCLLKTVPTKTIRCFVSGGDAMPDRIRAAFELIYRRKICSGYGMTETSPFISGSMYEATMPTNSVGKPLIGIETQIRHQQGGVVPQGTIGVLWLKGPNVMLGYYHEAAMTREVLVDGWLNTGDFAYQDREGNLVITGRLKDIIKHKGIIIYPPEIENVIMGHPNVLRVAVIGKDDEANGQVPIAFVQIKQDEADMSEALRQLCKKSLAAYKVPREFYCGVAELPLTATGKVDKKKLRADRNHAAV